MTSDMTECDMKCNDINPSTKSVAAVFRCTLPLNYLTIRSLISAC